MRAQPRVDPAAFRYGAADEGLAQLMRDFGEIDWFVPSPAARAEDAGAALLELQRRAARIVPERFPTAFEPTVMRAGWDAFLGLAARARSIGGWDWRFGALKTLSQRHAELRGWSRTDFVMNMPRDQHAPNAPGALYLRYGDAILWNTPFDSLPLQSLADETRREAAHWYRTYAVFDLCMAIEWQLAEDSSDLSGNPFAALISCYRTGYLPFGFGPDEVTLFGFDGIEAVDAAPATF